MPEFQLLKQEFPQFDQSTLPAIPPEWEDRSWHNDSCPRFGLGGVEIFIAEEKPEEREFPELPRYSVQQWQDADCDQILDTDDWEAALAKAKALIEATLISLDDFRASGRDVADLGEAISDESLNGTEGRVYLNSLHIEHWADDRHGIAPPNGPTYLLTIGNQQHEGDLPAMEVLLYQFGCSEGHRAKESAHG